MSLRLRNRDYEVKHGRVTAAADEGEALLDEVLFRLTVRRGSFPFLPELGSRMYQLTREKPTAWESLAGQYAAEALAELPDLTVTGTRVNRTDSGVSVAVELLWSGRPMTVAVQLEG